MGCLCGTSQSAWILPNEEVAYVRCTVFCIALYHHSDPQNVHFMFTWNTLTESSISLESVQQPSSTWMVKVRDIPHAMWTSHLMVRLQTQCWCLCSLKSTSYDDSCALVSLWLFSHVAKFPDCSPVKTVLSVCNIAEGIPAARVSRSTTDNLCLPYNSLTLNLAVVKLKTCLSLLRPSRLCAAAVVGGLLLQHCSVAPHYTVMIDGYNTVQ